MNVAVISLIDARKDKPVFLLNVNNCINKNYTIGVLKTAALHWGQLELLMTMERDCFGASRLAMTQAYEVKERTTRAF